MAYWKGNYELNLCQFLLENLKEDSCFIDVGAHAGYFSLFCAAKAKNGQVHSFEPEASNFSFIKRIKELNQKSNWNIYNKAVGSSKGKLFFSKGETSSTGRIKESGDIEVDVVKLDDELENLQKIDIIKIDVEGFGGRVIEGAMEIIEKFKPIIMFELHDKSDEFEVLLKRLSSWYDFTDADRNVKIDGLDPKVHFLFCRPKNIYQEFAS